MVAEVRFGVETIDHIAIPVRDLAANEAFYLNVLGLKYKTTRRNPDGSPRQTYVLAGENIIGLHLPGVSAGASSSTAPRIDCNQEARGRGVARPTVPSGSGFWPTWKTLPKNSTTRHRWPVR